MTPILIAPPAVEPVSLAEAKAWLSVENVAEDEVVGALVASARLVVESLTRRFLVAQTWRLVFDAWPTGSVALPFSPVRSVVVRTYDLDGASWTAPTANYSIDQYAGKARLRFIGAPPQPGRQTAGIEIDVEAGFATTAEGVPAPLRQAIRLLVARWYENRGDVEADADMARTPASVATLVAPYRRVRLS
ncbi:MAG: head-tail connector protein [Beijerinckiaceae bacterium]|nr:head-tail connector protein [Beijerinckiaceae bacterium]